MSSLAERSSMTEGSWINGARQDLELSQWIKKGLVKRPFLRKVYM